MLDDDLSKLKNNLISLKNEIATECGDNRLKLIREAIKTTELILKRTPDSSEAYSELGHLYYLNKNYTHAGLMLSKSLALSSKNVSALNQLSEIKNALGDFEQSLKLAEKVLEIDAKNTIAKCNQAVALRYMNNIPKATRLIKEVLIDDPNNAMAHYTLAQISLGLKDFETGFKELEWRKKEFSLIKEYTIPNIPFWEGENLDGKTIIINPELEIDILQFCRFVPVIAKKAKSVIFRVPLSLEKLMQENMPANVSVINSSEKVTGDLQIMIMSIPFILKTNPDNIPRLILRPNPKELSKVKFLFENKINKVGFCISRIGENVSNDINEEERRLAFEHAYKESFNDKYNLYSLNSEEYNMRNITDLSNYTHQYDKAAAVIAELDLIISIDSSIAHLAAMMNKETWVMTKKMAGWRYVDSSKKGIPLWYNNVRVLKIDNKKPLNEFLIALNQMVVKKFQ